MTHVTTYIHPIRVRFPTGGTLHFERIEIGVLGCVDGEEVGDTVLWKRRGGKLEYDGVECGFKKLGGKIPCQVRC